MHSAAFHDNATSASEHGTQRRLRERESDAESDSENPLPTDATWFSIPMILSPERQHRPQIPSVLTSTTPSVHEKLWWHPHARRLLASYLRRSASKEFASEAAIGGERWWDRRGGRGGVWTSRGEWIDAGDLCAPFGEEVFGDGKEGWVGMEEIVVPEVRVVVVGKDGKILFDPRVRKETSAEGEGGGDVKVEGEENEDGGGERTETHEENKSDDGSRDESETPEGTSSPLHGSDPETDHERHQGTDQNQPESGTPSQDRDSTLSETGNGAADGSENDIPIAVMPDGSRRRLSDFESR
jgi:hypothetical protein